MQKEKQQLIFGLGTGRCGTLTLSTLLNLQENYTSFHEGFLLPWEINKEKLNFWLNILTKKPSEYVCDTAFYYLPYVENILKLHPNAKFVCLKRNREDTVRSYHSKTKGRNHWTYFSSPYWEKDQHFLDAKWDNCFPKYDLPKQGSLIRYWNSYYAEAERLATIHRNNFVIFDMETCFNSEHGQRKLFSFISIPEEKMAISLNIVLNNALQ